MADQIATISKLRLRDRIGRNWGGTDMAAIGRAICLQLALSDFVRPFSEVGSRASCAIDPEDRMLDSDR